MSLYDEAKELIVGGSNLYSKRPELYSYNWPAYYKSAHGIEITAPDNRKYLDFSHMNVGSCVLGYASDDVDQAVLRAIAKGQTSSLLCEEEVELAKLLTTLHPWAQQVRYARSGGEAITIAIRIAQAYTGKTEIRYFPEKYHGWHVNSPLDKDQQFIPTSNNILKGKIAAYLIEPYRIEERSADWVEAIQTLAKSDGAVLIMDEISSGFRQNLGGRHLHYGVTPDIAVFSKAMSNGYPMAVVIGTKEVMQAAENTFISSTTWSERIGPTAALATIQKLWAEDVFKHTDYIGGMVKDAIHYHSKKAGLNVSVIGPNQMLHVQFPSIELQTKYTERMVDRGILAGKDFYPSYAHTLEYVEQFNDALEDIFPTLMDGKPIGPLALSGIKR